MVSVTVQSCLPGFASSSRLTHLAVDAAMMEDLGVGAASRVSIKNANLPGLSPAGFILHCNDFECSGCAPCWLHSASHSACCVTV